MHMEDDDETSSQINHSIASLLYCDEDPLISTTPPPPPQQQQASSVLATLAVGDVDQEEDHLKELLVDHLARQRLCAPTCRGAYLEHLLTPPPPPISPAGTVSAARSRGVHYIVYAFGRLGLTVATVFNAVNYLDRFLSINCHLCWEAWMVELVSVACLSIACKLDEVNIPSLHHLQMEEVMSHSFLPATVQDMELTLLKALQWRLACVTAYSFLQLLLPLITPPPPRTTTTATPSRCVRLLIRSLAEASFIQFDPSVVASSALRCVLELEDHQTYGHIISRLIRPQYLTAAAMDEAGGGGDACFRMMQTLYDGSDERRLGSPVSVIRPRPLELAETTAGGGSGRLNSHSRSAVRRRRLFVAPQGTTTQLLHEDDDGGGGGGGGGGNTTHVVRDEDISHTHTHDD